MEFAFNVNNLLPYEINILERDLIAKSPEETNCLLLNEDDELLSVSPQLKSLVHEVERDGNLGEILDSLGVASATAQGLQGPITSGNKLANSYHRLYLLKDPEGNSGQGSILGFLKIGYKHLIILDLETEKKEMNPLCILDFYVHESQQRQGRGKKLFDCMLQVEKKAPECFPVDRPSPKYLSFVAKHYCLKNMVPQVNKFVVFQEFFSAEEEEEEEESNEGMIKSTRKQSRQQCYTMHDVRKPQKFSSSEVEACLNWVSDEDSNGVYKRESTPVTGKRHPLKDVTTISASCSLSSVDQRWTSSWKVLNVSPPVYLQKSSAPVTHH